VARAELRATSDDAEAQQFADALVWYLGLAEWPSTDPSMTAAVEAIVEYVCQAASASTIPADFTPTWPEHPAKTLLCWLEETDATFQTLARAPGAYGGHRRRVGGLGPQAREPPARLPGAPDGGLARYPANRV
jgi:hypothetical protein